MTSGRLSARTRLTDAVSFVVGALVGYGLGENLGLNVFAEGYSHSSIVAIILIGLGGGFDGRRRRSSAPSFC